MTNEQILRKAIEKAVKNNWDKENYYWFNNKGEKTWNPVLQNSEAYKLFIFSHDFAKAFFGEEDYIQHWGIKRKRIAKWKWHLALMVLEEKPLKHLEKFL